MSYYAKIVDGIVEQVIVADAEVVAPLDGIWVETFMDDPFRFSLLSILTRQSRHWQTPLFY